MNTVWRFEYRIKREKHSLSLDDPLAELGGKVGEQSTVVIEVSPDRLAMLHDEALAVVIDHQSKRQTFIDLKARTHWERPLRRVAKRTSGKTPVFRIVSRSPQRNGEHRKNIRVDLDGLEMDLTLASAPVELNRSFHYFWMGFLHSLPGHVVRNHFVVDAQLADSHTRKSIGSITLTGHGQVENFDDAFTVPRDSAGGDWSRPRVSKAQTSPPPEKKEALGTVSQTFAHHAGISVKDFAFAFDQNAADAIRNVVNGVARAFGDFEGLGDDGPKPPHVVFDWWPQLRTRLDLGDDELDQEVIDLITVLLFLVRLGNGTPLVSRDEHENGATEDEQAQYQTWLEEGYDDTYADLFGVFLARIVAAVDTFPFSISRFATAAFETTTAPVTFDLAEDTSFRINETFIFIDLWDFDVTLSVNHKSVLESLELRDDHVHAIVTLDRIFVDFQYATLPTADPSSQICNALSLGLCTWLIQLQWGYGSVTMSQPRLALDIVPVEEDGRLGFDVVLDEEGSRIDFDLFLIGVNPIRDLAETLIISPLQSWLSSFFTDEEVFPRIAAALREVATDWFDIQALWRGLSLPPRDVDTFHVDTGSGVMEGDVTLAAALPERVASTIQTSHADPTAFVFTRRYLAAWLHSVLPAISSSTTFPVEQYLQALGIDPDALPARDTGAGEDFSGDTGLVESVLTGGDIRPPAPSSETFNRLLLQRSGVSISLPPDGVADHVGVAQFEYRFNVDRVTVSYRQMPVVVNEPCRLPPQYDDVRGPGLSPELGPGVDQAVEHFPSGIEPPHGEMLVNRPLTEYGMRNRERALRNADSLFPGRDPLGLCPPPYMDWVSRRSEEVVERFVSIRIRATLKLIVGFDVNAVSLIPLAGLTLDFLRGDDNERAVDLALVSAKASDNFTRLFGSLSDDAIETTLFPVVAEDVGAILNLIHPTNLPTLSLRVLPPPARNILGGETFAFSGEALDVLDGLFEWKQPADDDGNEPSTFRYIRDGDFVYWPVTARERVIARIE